MKIGIDLGGSHIAIGVVNNKGMIIEKTEKRILDKEKERILDVIEQYITVHVNTLAQKEKL